MRYAMLLLLAWPASAAPSHAREALGQYQGWGAFRQPPGHCFAVAEPVTRRSGGNRPFVAISRVRGGGGPRLDVVPSRPTRSDSPLRLEIGMQSFTLVGHGGADPRGDARIIAAIRGAERLRVIGIDPAGHTFHDDYPLAGAPSAIDAAIIGCLR